MTGTNASRKPLRRRGLVVGPRDRALLAALSDMEVVDCDQVKAVARFGSTTRANTRLLALTRAGLLNRMFIGSGGGRKALYSLSRKGAQVAEVPYRGIRRRKDEVLVADFFVQHQLTLNAVACALRFGGIPVPGIRFVNWLYFHEPPVAGLPLIPDGYAEFATPSGIDGSFIELDLGHESLAVFRRKAESYLQLALSGDFARNFRLPRFRVLVIAHSPRRVQTLRAAVAGVTEKIFWFAALDDVRGDGFFGPAWLRPVGDVPQTLFKDSR